MVGMAPGDTQRLKEMRNGLLRLHMTLLESERAIYERDVERIKNTGQYLNLVLNDPWFAWLRELSQFIVMVDEALAAKEPPADLNADRLLAQGRSLVSPAENGDAFGRSYYQAMQRDPGVVLAHHDIVQMFQKLGL